MAQPKIKTSIEARVKDTGDTMSGDLILNYNTYPRLILCPEDNNSYTFIEGSQNKISLQTSQMPFGNNYNNRRIFNLSNKKYSDNVKDCLYLSDIVDGNTTNYLLYGQHNKPTPAELEYITYGTQREDIPNNSDLNNYLEIGAYRCSTTNGARTLLNCPTDVAFIMDIIAGTGTNKQIDTNLYTYILQKITTYHGDIYFREINSNGSTGSLYYSEWRYFLHDKSDNVFLPLTGGTLTGDLIIKKTTSISDNLPATLTFSVEQTDNNIISESFIKVFDDGDNGAYGTNMVIQTSSSIVLGSGESPSNVYTNIIKPSSPMENTYISSDGNIVFFTNANTFANRKVAEIKADGNFWCGGVIYAKDGMHIRKTEVVKGTLPTEMKYWTFNNCDANGSSYVNALGQFETCLDTAGMTKTYIKARQFVVNTSSTIISPTLYVQVDINGNTKAGVENAVFYGAAWNDYAEYREQKEQIKPGYCAAAVNDGRLVKTSYRLQACDGIVSDTFGFAIGETEKCQTPLAVSGRVLAYFEGEREDYQAGDVVGAGPNGKVVKMTREEIKEYPDRIIGHVSEIPEYEVWGSGNVKVDGRIWIKVK